MTGKAVFVVGVAGTASDLYLTIREDSVTGAIHDQSRVLLDPAHAATVVVQTMANIATPVSGKSFVLTGYAGGLPNISIDSSKFFGLQTMR